MEIHIVPLEDMLAAEPCPVSEQRDLDVFSSGTEACLMNCRRETKHKYGGHCFLDPWLD